MSLTPNPPNIPSQRPPGKDPRSVILGLEQFSGPLPHPELLQGYEAACPGAAERIIKMAEDQGEHRRNLEKQMLEMQGEDMRREFAEARVGQVFAFAISALFLGCGTYTAVHGQAVVGTIFGAFGIGGIVTTFIKGRTAAQFGEKSEDKQEPERKQQSEPPKRKRQRR